MSGSNIYQQTLDSDTVDYTFTLKHIGINYHAGFEQATRAKAQAKTVIPHAIAAGHSEREIARLLGVDRMTVRAWQGKRK